MAKNKNKIKNTTGAAPAPAPAQVVDNQKRKAVTAFEIDDIFASKKSKATPIFSSSQTTASTSSSSATTSTKKAAAKELESGKQLNGQKVDGKSKEKGKAREVIAEDGGGETSLKNRENHEEGGQEDDEEEFGSDLDSEEYDSDENENEDEEAESSLPPKTLASIQAAILSQKKKKKEGPLSIPTLPPVPNTSSKRVVETIVDGSQAIEYYRPTTQTAALDENDLRFTDSRGETRRRTDEGYPIYDIKELKIGLGGGTPDCPFDCQCCF